MPSQLASHISNQFRTSSGTMVPVESKMLTVVACGVERRLQNLGNRADTSVGEKLVEMATDLVNRRVCLRHLYKPGKS